MSETKKRNTHLPGFKAKVGLGAVRGLKTVHQIAQECGVHPVQAGKCVLAVVVRGTVYAQRKSKSPDEADEVLKRLIDGEYTRHPFYGSRKMAVYLGRCGHRVNRKRAQRLSGAT
jgi:predicted amidohydrolase